MTLGSGQGGDTNLDLVGGGGPIHLGQMKVGGPAASLATPGLGTGRMGQASLVPPRLLSWSAKDFRMESAKTARACYPTLPCDPDAVPILNKQSSVYERQIGDPNLLLRLHSLHACGSVI